MRNARDAYTLIDWLPPFPSSGAAFTLSLIRLYLNRFRLFSHPSTRDEAQFHRNQRSRPGNRLRFLSEALPVLSFNIRPPNFGVEIEGFFRGDLQVSDVFA
jgi:hypothetical protein